jgi:hypothetical protein
LRGLEGAPARAARRQGGRDVLALVHERLTGERFDAADRRGIRKGGGLDGHGRGLSHGLLVQGEKAARKSRWDARRSVGPVGRPGRVREPSL